MKHPEYLRPVEPGTTDTPLPAEPVAAQIRRHQAEARSLANGHVRTLTESMTGAVSIAREIADGGDSYSPGIRDMCRRFAEDAEDRVAMIAGLMKRLS
jgi:hypothetical protein